MPPSPALALPQQPFAPPTTMMSRPLLIGVGVALALAADSQLVPPSLAEVSSASGLLPKATATPKEAAQVPVSLLVPLPNGGSRFSANHSADIVMNGFCHATQTCMQQHASHTHTNAHMRMHIHGRKG